MTIEIVASWWLIPTAITIGTLAWAIPMRQEERPDGSMFSGMAYAFGGGFRIAGAIIFSLVAWLIWALLA